MAQNRHGAMSDLSPLCEQKQTCIAATIKSIYDDAAELFLTVAPQEAQSLKVCPETSGRIAEFSEHEAD